VRRLVMPVRSECANGGGIVCPQDNTRSLPTEFVDKKIT
jgi:hypothetical protein